MDVFVLLDYHFVCFTAVFTNYPQKIGACFKSGNGYSVVMAVDDFLSLYRI